MPVDGILYFAELALNIRGASAAAVVRMDILTGRGLDFAVLVAFNYDANRQHLPPSWSETTSVPVDGRLYFAGLALNL